MNLHSHYRNQALKLILRAGDTFVLDGAYVARFCFCIGCVVIALRLNCRRVGVTQPALFPKCSQKEVIRDKRVTPTSCPFGPPAGVREASPDASVWTAPAADKRARQPVQEFPGFHALNAIRRLP